MKDKKKNTMSGLGKVTEIDLMGCLVCNKGSLKKYYQQELYICDNGRCVMSISEKKLKSCPTKDCLRKFVEIEDPLTHSFTGHLFRPDCKHFPEGVMISIG